MRKLLSLVLLALPLYAQDHAALYPADTFLYAEADGAALAKGLPELDLVRLIADPNVRPFLKPAFERLEIDPEKPVEALLKHVPIADFVAGKVSLGIRGARLRIVAMNGQQRVLVVNGSNPLEARHLFEILGAAALAEMDGGGAHRLKFLFSFDFLAVGEPGPKLKQVIAQALEHEQRNIEETKKIQIAGREVTYLRFKPDRIEDNFYYSLEVYADMSGDRWIFSSSREQFEAALQGGPRSSLAQAGGFQSVRKRLTGGSRVLFWFADVAKITRMLDSLISRFAADVSATVGLSSIRGVGAGVSLIEGGVRESFGVVLDGQPKGLWTLLDAFPGGMRALDVAPPGALAVIGNKFDAKILVDRLGKVAADIFPGTKELLIKGMDAGIKRETGFSLVDDILPALGDEVALILYPPPGVGLPIPEFVFGLDIGNEEPFKKILEHVKGLVVESGAARFAPIDLGEGVEAFQVFAAVPIAPPVFALHKGHLFGASSPDLMKKVVSTWGVEGAQTLAKDGPLFRKIHNGLNGGDNKSLIALLYLNVNAAIPHAMQMMQMFAGQIPAGWVDLSRMPTAETIQKYVSGLAFGIRRDGDGITFDAFSQTGVSMTGAALGMVYAIEQQERMMREFEAARVRQAAQDPNAAVVGINIAQSDGNGITVLGVSENGPAEVGGLKPNDKIVAVDGVAVGWPVDLHKELLKRKPGETVKLSVVRGQETLEITVNLGRRADIHK